MLYHHAADIPHRFSRVVGDNYVSGNLLAMVVDFTIEGHFEVDLAVAEGESLAHQRAWKTATAGRRSMLELNNIKINKLVKSVCNYLYLLPFN